MRNPLDGINGEPGLSRHKRAPELELIPAVREHRKGLITYSPLGNGLIKDRGTMEESGDLRLKKFKILCGDLGVEPADAAIAWILQNPAVTAPVIGPSNRKQFRKTLHALEIKLPEDFLIELEKLFPGPGEAPESYAW